MLTNFERSLLEDCASDLFGIFSEHTKTDISLVIKASKSQIYFHVMGTLLLPMYAGFTLVHFVIMLVEILCTACKLRIILNTEGTLPKAKL